MGFELRARLLELLKEHSYAKKKVTLASGRESDFFIDCKQTVLLAEGHSLVSDVMLGEIVRIPTRPVAVAGVELGGCPLASAVAMRSFERGMPLDAIYVRKTPKSHGSQRLMEGDARIPNGAPVVILEDVVTTGGSTLAAVDKLRERGLEVVSVIALVDRLEGGREAIEKAGLPFVAIFTRTDFDAGTT